MKRRLLTAGTTLTVLAGMLTATAVGQAGAAAGAAAPTPPARSPPP